MKIGFLGTGHITSSVIEGIFKSKLNVKKIYISPRNRLISKKLARKFKKIAISKNNQQLIDKSNWVFLAITPKVGQKILKSLNFRKNQKIIASKSSISDNQLLSYQNCTVNTMQNCKNKNNSKYNTYYCTECVLEVFGKETKHISKIRFEKEQTVKTRNRPYLSYIYGVNTLIIVTPIK